MRVNSLYPGIRIVYIDFKWGEQYWSDIRVIDYAATPLVTPRMTLDLNAHKGSQPYGAWGNMAGIMYTRV